MAAVNEVLGCITTDEWQLTMNVLGDDGRYLFKEIYHSYDDNDLEEVFDFKEPVDNIHIADNAIVVMSHRFAD